MARDRWSDTNSTRTSSSRQSMKYVGAVAEIARRVRGKDRVTICVAPEQTLEKLENACEYTRGLFERESPPMRFTASEGLQDAIDTIKLSSKRRILNILVSPEIPEIGFDVPSHFSQLQILRCAKQSDGGTVFVDGSSTYNGVRLDKWQAHQHKHHTLLIGHERGVRIKLNDIVSLPNWARCRSDFSASEQAALREHFETLSGKSRWDEVKGIVAAIVGIAVGTVKFGASLSGAVGGIYVKYTFGFHALELGAAGAKMTFIATAAGNAVVLGVAAGVAVYFVPWGSLFDWLKGAFVCLWEKISVVWERFKDWVMSFFGSPEGPRPMAFS